MFSAQDDCRREAEGVEPAKRVATIEAKLVVPNFTKRKYHLALEQKSCVPATFEKSQAARFRVDEQLIFESLVADNTNFRFDFLLRYLRKRNLANEIFPSFFGVQLVRITTRFFEATNDAIVASVQNS